MTKHWSGAQWDLFEEPPRSTRLGNIERAKAVEQLRVLLAEAMAGLDGRQETGDDDSIPAVRMAAVISSGAGRPDRGPLEIAWLWRMSVVYGNWRRFHVPVIRPP